MRYMRASLVDQPTMDLFIWIKLPLEIPSRIIGIGSEAVRRCKEC